MLSHRSHLSHRLMLGVVALSALAACRGQTSRDEPIVGIRNMYDQPKYETQEESAFFPDHRTMRPLVDGVVAYDEEVDPQLAQGRLDDESGYVLEIPKTVIDRNGGAARRVRPIANALGLHGEDAAATGTPGQTEFAGRCRSRFAARRRAPGGTRAIGLHRMGGA